MALLVGRGRLAAATAVMAPRARAGLTTLATAAPPQGFRAAGVVAGIKKKKGMPDVALITSDTPCLAIQKARLFSVNGGRSRNWAELNCSAAAAVFTQNRFQAAPVLASKDQLQRHAANISTIVVNSGCANACTGERGLADARATLDKLQQSGLGQGLLMSTGVIGPFLPLDKLYAGIDAAKGSLSSEGWEAASRAIMTTDTVNKLMIKSYKLDHNGKSFSMAGMAKGAGMIHPNMATMLCVLTTDAAVTPGALQAALKFATDRSFNAISVDGDSSTNDSMFVLANGRAGNPVITEQSPEFSEFRDALCNATADLAKRLVRDGEGATKFVTVRVQGARTFAEAKQVASSVCRSNLVKTAFFGQDANWGRIVCAVGYSGVSIQPERVNLWFGMEETGTNELHLFKNGMPFDTNEEKASAILKCKDFSVRIDLGQGTESATMWTCDFSYEYVKINADYRS